MALHVLSAALTNLNRSTVDVVSFDSSSTASNWDGSQGFTDGNCRLGTSPLKDATYPGTLGEDPELDEELVKFSWTTYLRCTGQLNDWVDRGYPSCTHKQWAEYLKWATVKSKADSRKGTIEKVVPSDQKVAVYIKGRKTPLEFDGFVYTGPGIPICIPTLNSRRSDRLLDAKTFWSKKASVKGTVCVVGTRESCAAILESFMTSNTEVQVSVVAALGYLPLRDEGYSANSMFSNPAKWKELSLDVRKRIISRADRGAISPRCHKEMASSQTNIREIYGIVHVAKCGRNSVELKSKSPMDWVKKILITSLLLWDSIFGHICAN